MHIDTAEADLAEYEPAAGGASWDVILAVFCACDAALTAASIASRAYTPASSQEVATLGRWWRRGS